MNNFMKRSLSTLLLSGAFFVSGHGMQLEQQKQAVVPVEKQQMLNADLIKACYAGNAIAVRNLLKAGANPIACDENGRPALLCTLQAGHSFIVDGVPDKGLNLGMINRFTEAGANIDVEDNQGITALIRAVSMACTLDKGIEVIKGILELGANIEHRDLLGRTALMAACYHGDIETVKFLLSRGALISTQDKEGKTAFDFVPRGRIDIITLLGKAGTVIV